MRRPAVAAACAGMLAVAGWARPAAACSVKHIATPKELVQQAEVILIGQVFDFRPGETDASGKVSFKVMRVLKGDYAGVGLVVSGNLDYQGHNTGGAPYKGVRPGGLKGMCYAFDYEMDKYFLLFLRAGSPYWAPLAATNEEVFGLNDPWVEWVKRNLPKKKR